MFTCPFSQKEIMEAECELLIFDLKDPKTIALVKDSIIRISNGSSPHCAGALNLILDKALDLQKRNSEAKLRCPCESCPWYNDRVSYSVIEPYTCFCKMCINRGWGSRHLVCAGCGYTRLDNDASCKKCERRFV